MTDLPTLTARELPDLIWHHDQKDDPALITRRWATPFFDGYRSKPVGGLFASVIGQGRNGGAVSSWAEFCATEYTSRCSPFATRLHPHPDARFARLDSASDAAALAQACPGTHGMGTLSNVLGGAIKEFQGKVPDPSPALAGLLGYGPRQPPLVDFTRIVEQGCDGVYVSAEALAECRSLGPGVPDLWGWDVAQVWFAAPALSPGSTRRWRWV